MICEYLKRGEKNAIKANTLCEITGYDHRTILKMIEKERSNGHLICATGNGYFLASTTEELADFYERYTGTARKMFYNVRHFKKVLDMPTGQRSLF